MSSADSSAQPLGDRRRGPGRAGPPVTLRINATASYAERGPADFYPSPPEAVAALLACEGGPDGRLPRVVWEPAAGDGAIVRPLRQAGYHVHASDLHDYGLEDSTPGADYLTAPVPAGVEAVVTNPPFRLAAAFAAKAVAEAPYVALLLRLNWLESTGRLPFFRAHPPARLWVSSRRLPMMHRAGWTGPTAASNVAYAWYIWDRDAPAVGALRWFDWREAAPARGRGR
jgi:hypothetical protein